MPENKKFWKFCNQAGNKVELLLYGDISQTSWWGDEVTPKQFAEELAGLGALDEITVRINSGGGDVFAAQAIGNQLEQHPAAVTAKIDGLCASAATIVACHCGKVIAANDSTYMVHPVRMGACGYYNAEELQKYIEAMNAIRESIVGLYAKKTGRDKDEVAGWMDETSWWTAAQAKENGFIDELTDEADGTVIENRDGLLFVNSVNTHLPFDKAPNFVQSSKAAPASCSVNNKCHKEVTNMANEIKTVDDLRGAYPALVNEIEEAAANKATSDERQRIHDIEDMALSGSEALRQRVRCGHDESCQGERQRMAQRSKGRCRQERHRRREERRRHRRRCGQAGRVHGRDQVHGQEAVKEEKEHEYGFGKKDLFHPAGLPDRG